MGFFAADISSFMQGHVLDWLLGASLALLAVALAHGLLSARRQKGLKSSLQAAHSELLDLRNHDPLTGLVSRQEFEVLLEAEAVLADRGTATGDSNSGSLVVLYVGLDNFRSVNEAYGMHVGDALLVEAASRLSALVGQAPHVARVAGDEFVLLMHVGKAGALTAASAIQRSLAAPCWVEALALNL